MSGPSIRNWELASALSAENEVTLAAPGAVGRRHPAFRVISYDRQSLVDLAQAHDVCICSGFLLHENPALLQCDHLVVDMYGPFQLESLHMFEDRSISDRVAMGRSFRGVLGQLMSCGDLFLCASERQKDFWLGWLDSHGRVNVVTHKADPGYNSMVRVVPFGLPEERPTRGRARFRGVLPGIGQDDFVVLWGGGIWNWFDPLTLIQAASATRDALPNLRVLFPSTASPSEQVPAMHMARQARALSDSLGLTGRRVFFGDGWVPYEERGSVFLEADLGVSLHLDDIETRFSFRTRVLDYLWAGLPVLTTQGDSMADLVAEHDLGAVVSYADVEGVAAALVALSDPDRRKACGSRSAALSSTYRWSAVAGPLLEYCANPQQAADHDQARGGLLNPTTVDPAVEGPAELVRLGRRSIEALRGGGFRRVKDKGREYLRRRWARPRRRA